MKKALAMVIVGVMLLCTLCSCGKVEGQPYGEYVMMVGTVQFATYEFKSNKVHTKFTPFTSDGEEKDGTWTIDESDEITIEYEDGGNDKFKYNADEDYLYIGEKDDPTLILNNKK